ncbi:hypothetical protein C0J52_24408 [Blattella germanica]|nr:hypothetical protein C0J52_24408 [Blattella germanica]
MEHTETTLSLRSSDRPTAERSGAFDGLSVEEQLVMYEDMESDVQNHKGEVEKVVALGRRLVEEMQNENETIKDEEQKVSEIEHRWSGLPALLQERKERIQFLQEKKQLYGEISSLELILEGYQKWLEGLKSTPQGQVNVSHQLEQCRVKIKSMKSHEDRITKMRKRAADLSASQLAGNDANTINVDVNGFLERWGELMLRLAEKQTELSNTVDKSPPKKYLEAMEALMKWVHNVEGVLLSEHAVVADIAIMEDQLQKFKELQKTIEEQQNSFHYVNTTGQELIHRAGSETQSQRLKDELQELNTRWNIEMLRQFRDEMEGLNSWLQEVEAFLEAEEDLPVGDIETLDAQLEQSNALQDDIETLQPNVNNIESTSQKLLNNADPTFSEELRSEVGILMEKWKIVVKGAKEQNVNEGVEEFTSWLCKLETEVPTSTSITSSAELFQMKGKYQILKDKVDRRTEEFRNLNEMGNDLLLSSEGNSIQEVARKFTHLNAKWSDVTDGIYDKYKILKEASHEYGEFRGKFIGGETDIILYQNGARDLTVLLEGSVQEAQESESHILEFQEWVTHVDALLTARVENDLTADDLPDDDQRLVEEFETQESTLKEMEDQVKTYASAGKHEAAARLQEQMILLQRFYRTLSEIKGEVESIIKSGRKLVEEKAVADPQAFNKRIDTLKELYNKLGSQITEAKGILDSALELSRNLQKDIPALNEWIDGVEVQLDEYEAVEPTKKNLDAEVSFLKRTVEEDVPKWSIIKDGIKSSYKTFSGICDPVYLEVLKERVNDTVKKWERLEGRLRNLLPILEKENAISARNKLEEFTKSVEEMNKWLNEVESKVNKLDVLPAHQLAEVHVSECKFVNKLRKSVFNPTIFYHNGQNYKKYSKWSPSPEV